MQRLVGRSAAMLQAKEQLRRVAPREAPVLIHGASGTGKELAARIVHDLSLRSDGPFVPVDCGAFAESLLESELFGHARGAFTNAQVERRGLFEEAGGGTLFLDEITNTSRGFQARLLRVLQEREIRQIGSNQVRPVNVRVVAASNVDLTEAVLEGSFREDLLYRLDVLQVRMPSLSDRLEDLPELSRAMLVTISERSGEALELSSDALSLLLLHSWPGNVRELGNVLESAAAFAVDGVIGVEQLPERLRGPSGLLGSSLNGAPDCAPRGLRALVERFECSVLRAKLEANDWNRTLTARQLGITRRCLFNKISRYGLSSGSLHG